MAKRGLCRCGNLLLFEQTPQGYKMRCPVCRSIVRLRLDDASKQPNPHPANEVPAEVPSPPLPPQEDLSDDLPPDFSWLEIQKSSSPVALAEIPVPKPKPGRKPASRGLNWWVLGAAVIGVLILLGSVALMLG